MILIFLFPDIWGFILVLAQENTPMSTSKAQFMVIVLLHCYYTLLDQDQIAQQSAELMSK